MKYDYVVLLIYSTKSNTKNSVDGIPYIQICGNWGLT